MVIKNPRSNKLGKKISEKELKVAIEKSGFPLQIYVSNKIHPLFKKVYDEWSYFDDDKSIPRAIDILAEKELFKIKDIKKQPKIRPILDVIIECKKSDNPYIFFLSSQKFRMPYFPIAAGTPYDDIEISFKEKGLGGNIVEVLASLGMYTLPFHKLPRFCNSFTHSYKKGKQVRFSDEESYHSLMLPLLKATRYFQKIQKPKSTAKYFDCHLIIGLAVIDAPMIGVEVLKKTNKIKPIPWVRVLRHESSDKQIGPLKGKSSLFAVDVIHKDFLESYLKNHLFPYAEKFSKKINLHQQILLNGTAIFTASTKKKNVNFDKYLKTTKTKRINYVQHRQN